MIRQLPLTTETDPDENNIITRTEYKLNEKNEIIQIVKKIKRYKIYSRIYPSVIERKNNWVKFGEAAKDNNNVTFLSEEDVFMEPPTPKLSSVKQKNFIPEIKLEEPCSSEQICKICNGNHWTRICNFDKGKKEEKEEEKQVFIEKVPEKKEDIFALQITELSKDINEFDLYTMFSKIGKVQNILIMKDFNTQESRGVSFVIFKEENDLNYAKKVFHNMGFANLRLKVEYI
jgi:hypothetical protein